MTKNLLAHEAAASEPPPSKRQKLEPSQSRIEQGVTETAATLDNTFDKEASMAKASIGDEERVRELKAGIEQFVNPQRKGFRGVLKQRYTDFMVNEISLDGSVLHLKSDQAPNFHAIAKVNEQNPEELQQLPKQEIAPESSELPTKIEPTEEKSTVVETEATPASFVKVGADHETIKTQGDPATTEETRPFSLSPEDDTILVDYFGAEFKEKILQFHEKILAKPAAKPSFFGSLLSEPFTDRVRRGKLHGDVRRIFKSRLETTSVDGGNIKFSAATQAVVKSHGKSFITLQNQNQGGRVQRVNQAKGKLGWDELGGQYLHFTLFKENKDTMEVLGYLARTMRIKPKDFAFSGTKDRRAVTVQRVSLFRQHAKDLARLNSSIRQARIGDFKYEKHPLKLGELNGNFFTISLRDCHFDDEEGLNGKAKSQLAEDVVRNAVEDFKEHGFINYYGLQRFGTFTVSNDIVGTQILNGNFEGAIRSILHYNPGLIHGDPNTENRVGRDDIARARAIHEFETTGHSKAALDHLPRRFNAEATIIRHLGNKNSRQDYHGALGMIQRNLKTMYVHAYQSLVWNAAASERWVRYGGKVVEGDLVIVDGNDNSAANNAKEELDENGEIIVLPAEDDSALQADEKFERARPLSEEEVASGKYSIFDIVLPTPGFDVEYPQNDIGDFYKEYMGSERGGGLDPADMRRPQKDFSLSGNYRKLLARAEDLSFTIKEYYEETEQLTETDLDILDKDRPKNDGGGQQRNGKHDWYSQRGSKNARDGFANDRRNFDRSSNDGASRFTRDIRFEDPNFVNTKASNQKSPEDSSAAATNGSDKADEERKAKKAAALLAWKALPAKLAAEEEAALQASMAKRANGEVEKQAAPSYQIEETYTQTTVDKDGHRHIVGSTTRVVQAGGESESAITEIPDSKDVTKSQTAQPAPDKSSIDADGEKTAAKVQIQAQTAPDIAENSTVAVSCSDDVKPEPKIAVIIKFALGTSQYATMALRELLKAGGLTPYKPDFSLGR